MGPRASITGTALIHRRRPRSLSSGSIRPWPVTPGRSVMRLYALVAVTAGLLPGAEPPPPNNLAVEAEGLRGEWRLVCTQDERHIDRGSEQIRMRVQGDAQMVFRFG